MRVVRLIGLLAVVLLLLALSTLSAAAADPVAANLPNVPPIDGQAHNVAPNTSLWYRYTFGGDSQVVLELVNGKASGLEMRIFSGAQIASWWKEDPIGVAAPLDVGNDLYWMGAAPNGETVYVQIVNANPYTANALVLIETARDVEALIP